MTKYVIPFILIFLLGNLEANAQCAADTNLYTFTHNGTNYEVVREKKSWSDAAACAVERGGYLVEINDAAEQLAVYNAISAAGVSSTYTIIPTGGGIAYIWLGATDQATEGTWLWDGNNNNSGTHFWTGKGSSGGTSVSGRYHNWGGKSTGTLNEPDDFGGTQHFAAMALAGWPSGTTLLGIGGEWNDINGSSLLYYIIEKNTSGSSNNNGPSGIKIMPNPCFDQILLEYPSLGHEVSFQLVDITGKIIQKGIVPSSNILNTGQLNAGLYNLHLIESSNIRRTKFIKQ